MGEQAGILGILSIVGGGNNGRTTGVDRTDFSQSQSYNRERGHRWHGKDKKWGKGKDKD